MPENIIMDWSSQSKKYILIILMLLIPFVVFGQPCPPEQVCIENPLGEKTLQDVLTSIVNWLFGIIVIGIGPIMYIIAGFRFLTAAGDPEKVNTAKRMALWTTIGLIVATGVYSIIQLIKDILGI